MAQPKVVVRKKEQKTQGLYSDFVKEAKKEPPKSTVPIFVSITRSAHGLGKRFSFGKGAQFSQEQKDNISFLNYDVTAEEFYGAYFTLAFFGILLGIIAAFIAFIAMGSVDANLKLLAGAVLVLIPLGASYFYLTFPASQVDHERKLSLAYVPEIVNYLIMSMRLTPNLEKAVEFAATHGRGKIAEDLKKIVWEVQIGKFASIEEGLDDLAYRWGDKSDDFKHALMLIRSSLMEVDDARRSELLEKAGNDVLEGSKEKMDLYARQLSQPTVYLYYFGILLPLLMAIILPIGSSFTGQEIAKPEYLILLYNIFIPIGILLFGFSILGNRPPTYVAPEIPEDFPGLSPKGTVQLFGSFFSYKTLALAAFATIFLVGMFLDQQLIASVPSYELDETIALTPHLKFFYEEQAELKLFVGYLSLFGFLVAFSVAASIYLLAKYSQRKAVQDEIRNMEGEFKDALYVLASRLGENRPMEDALKHATEFLPKSKIANKIFKKILENISSMGMTVDAAIFDPSFGAIKNYPSLIIRSGMRIMADAVELGVNVAAKSLISLSLQLRNAQKIDLMLRKLLEDVTVMLGTMSTFVAPIVLAVVASMQKMIVDALARSCGQQTDIPAQTVSTGQLGGMGNLLCKGGADSGANADPLMFTFIMGIYVIEIVVLLSYFNAQIEDPNNDLHAKTTIAFSLPIAVILFCATAYAVASFITPS